MKILAFGDIIVHGKSAFTSVCSLDGTRLKVTFAGSIRVDSPSRHLAAYLAELGEILPGLTFESAVIDFRELSFCNSNGFYVVMDITELVMKQNGSSIEIQRLADDDWHQETLPILLNVEDPTVHARITFVDHESL